MSATIHFLPWMRSGLATRAVEPADADGVPRAAGANVEARLESGGFSVTRSLRLRGPSSVRGLASDQILRTMPGPGSTEHPPNLFASVDLRSPELPWMFTPAAPADGRLMPWLVLVVIEDGSLERGAGLPVLHVEDVATRLPDLREAYAWAHVQAATDLSVGVEEAYRASPSAFSSRLLCPRRLEPRRSYLACIVPAFESGRLAGLGSSAEADPVALAWTELTPSIDLPVYYSFSFRTARQEGDFEELVRRLVPMPLDPRTGLRDLDLSDPGSDRLPEVDVRPSFVGALTAPDVEPTVLAGRDRRAYARALDELLADSQGQPWDGSSPYDARVHDPVVGLPAYGLLPAKLDDVPALDGSPQWLAETNLEPRHRAAAGLGAEVVRRNQETLMAQAWEQAQGARDLARLLNRTRLAREVSERAAGGLRAMPDGTLLQLTAPAHRRAQPDAARTLRGHIQDSVLPSGLVSAAFRRRVARGTSVSKALAKTARPPAERITEKFTRQPARMLSYATLTVPHGAVFVSGEAASVETLERRAPVADPIATSRSYLGSREPTAAVRAVSGLGTAVARSPVATPALTDLAGLMRAEVSPTEALSARLRHIVRPSSILGDSAVPGSVFFSPTFHTPLYAALVRIDSELLMPGVGRLTADSVGLARVNAAFVEAFLLGANHELGRELVWREYPADPADSWLHTFWDSLDDSGHRREDIVPIPSFDAGPLGRHFTPGVDPDRTLVLVVKSELLRRYPGTIITAVEAEWVNGRTKRMEKKGAEPVFPGFAGTLAPDVFFFGFLFDSTVEVPQDIVGGAGRAGYYFAFEEPPTERSFGLDTAATDESSGLGYWKDLTWADVGEGSHVSLASRSGTLPFDELEPNDWDETWARDAAAMARITLQRPVRMLVHADQLMTIPEDDDGA